MSYPSSPMPDTSCPSVSNLKTKNHIIFKFCIVQGCLELQDNRAPTLENICQGLGIKLILYKQLELVIPETRSPVLDGAKCVGKSMKQYFLTIGAKLAEKGVSLNIGLQHESGVDATRICKDIVEVGNGFLCSK